MPYLTPGVSINPGDIVTRQTIYDVLALGGLGSAIQSSELDSAVITITSQSLPPSNPPPGMVWWDQTEQLLKVWTDAIEGTACSVWLAFGPDAFDVALYAAESIPYGAAVIPAPNLGTRACMLPTDPGSQAIMASGPSWTTIGRYYNLRFMALNQSTHPTLGPANPYTTPSGSWFAGRLYGMAYGWAPGSRSASPNDASVGLNGTGYFMCFLSGASGLTNPSGVSNLRGAVAGAAGEWTVSLTEGGVWAENLHRCSPMRATAVPRDHYVRCILRGVRYKGQ